MKKLIFFVPIIFCLLFCGTSSYAGRNDIFVLDFTSGTTPSSGVSPMQISKNLAHGIPNTSDQAEIAGVSTFRMVSDFPKTWTVEYSGVTPDTVALAAGGTNEEAGVSLYVRGALLEDDTWSNKPYHAVFLNWTIANLKKIGPIGFIMPDYEYAQFFIQSGDTVFGEAQFVVRRGSSNEPPDPITILSGTTGMNANSDVFTIPYVPIIEGSCTFTFSGDGVYHLTWDGTTPTDGNGTEIGSGYLSGIGISAKDALRAKIHAESGVTPKYDFTVP